MKKIVFSLMAIALLLSSCNKDKHDHETDEHDHDEMALSFTMFASDFEMFTEIEPLAVGEASSVIAHFTKLDDYKPLLTGSLQAKFEVGNTHSEVELSKPARAGIFTFSVTPQTSGHGHIEFIVKSGALIDTFLVHIDIPKEQDEMHGRDCNHDHEAEEESHDHASDQSHEDGITFLKEQAWKTDFGIYKSSLAEFAVVIPATGEIQATSTNEYQVVAKHSGIILFEMDNLLPGMELTPKDDILIIGSEDIMHDNFETLYAKVKLEFETAEKEFNRATQLFKDRIIAEKEYLEIEKEYLLVKKDMELFKAHYKPGGHHIHLKKKAYLKQLLVEEGEYVEIGQPLLEITSSNKLLLKVEVQQKYLSSLSQEMSANFKVNYSEVTYDLNNYDGKLLSIGQSIARNSTLIPVYFKFNNPDNILPGSYATVYLKIPEQDKKLIVPVEALIETQGTYQLIVQLEGELYAKRDVKIGASDGQMIEILDGLTAGEVVVTKGAYRVYLASMSSDLPAHAHVH